MTTRAPAVLKNTSLSYPIQRQFMTNTVNWWGIASNIYSKCAVGLKIFVQIAKFKNKLFFLKPRPLCIFKLFSSSFCTNFTRYFKFLANGPWFRLFSVIPFPIIGWNLLEVWKFHYEYKLASVTLGLYCRHFHANIAVCA